MKISIYDYLNQGVPIEDKFCFVIMPFDRKLDDLYYKRVKPIVEEVGYSCKRADQNIDSTPIMFEIFEDILKAQVIIADLTGANPNVFYELGICNVLKKNIILLNRKGSDVPFDLSGIRHFNYEDSTEGEVKLREFLKDILAQKEEDEQTSIFDKPLMNRNLKKFHQIWKSGKEILIGFEDFMEIVLGLEYLSPTDSEIAFLCVAASYYGKFMRRMSKIAYCQKEAINALVIEAATGVFTRVPWRAAIMLEHFDNNLVEIEISEFADKVLNTSIFPESILKKSTVTVLMQTINNPNTRKGTSDKLAEVLRQIQAEFG